MPQNFLTDSQKTEITKAIQAAELNSSGEIRIHIEKICATENVLDRAAEVFVNIGMNNTAQQNGVLFYLSIDDRKFAVLGDKGIDKVVPENFWESTKALLKTHFAQGLFTEGLVKAIHLAGEQLKHYFPYQSDDINELPDDISFG
ncbi:TLP18.3/Psb32/MOLO-1 phosphatase superfamily protein [Arcicella aurantiaca]|uniref:TLP18.3/Psb32/MOLO-1 phosphatase superfamily protein n=1 Tax=Arcicella aurantiaca TaxID=591202 RepID=A0A316ESX3_9BACT|nr:TPM domain-containing protein [Arcicella aurantiaca]PWK26260.1 TLP18.3/Psb32/MOLO-1 phosphatase superfamily protein [Arcicella aurantiaca]